jgi:phosphoribosylglycinamide formyltransferase-1
LKPLVKIGILISGRGSNMLALAEAVREGRIAGALVAVVISDRVGAAGLTHAREREIETLLIERRGRTRDEHEGEVISALRASDVELVCLAGYMRLLSGSFIDAYRGRVLNIHPSLLPSFPGLDAQRQALRHGVKWTGCTVHFVDETLDGGPIIEQRIVRVHDDDTEETLSERILKEEHQLYPQAVARVVSEEYEIVGRRVIRKRI